MALQADEPKALDTTQPDSDTLISRVGKSVQEFTRSTDKHPNRYADLPRAAGKDGNDGSDDDSNKRPKVSKERASQDISQLEKLLAADFGAAGGSKQKGGKAITNDVLKDYLKQKGVKGFAAKKKAELRDLVREQLVKDGKLRAAYSDDDD